MIVTLATQIIFRGIAEIVLGSGGSISVTNTEGFAALGGKVGRVPYILFLVLILGIIAAVILGKCTFGRRVYAIGTNRLAAYTPESMYRRSVRDLHPDGEPSPDCVHCF